MPGKASIPILAFCALCAACAPFSSSNEPTLEQRVQRQDAQLRQMQPQQADTWNQLQAMKQELDELKGQLNDLNNAGGARGIVDKVRQHDAALRQVDNNMALNLELGAPMAAQAPASPDPAVAAAPQSGLPMTGLGGIQTTGAPESSAYGAARTVQQPAAQPSGNYGLPPDVPQTQPTINTPAVAPSESTWGQADPQPQAQLQVPQKDISLALFDAGVNSYNARDYTAAERSFTDFLKNYPSHSQAAEAQYYLAECLFQSNHFSDAALAYETVIKKYPKSSSAPGAYLKQAICFSKMKQPAAAKARMQEIIAKFPNSSEAARARSFLKTNK